MAQFFGPNDQRSATADFLVLDSLCVRDDGRVQHGLVFDLAGCFVGLLDDVAGQKEMLMPITGKKPKEAAAKKPACQTTAEVSLAGFCGASRLPWYARWLLSRPAPM